MNNHILLLRLIGFLPLLDYFLVLKSRDSKTVLFCGRLNLMSHEVERFIFLNQPGVLGWTLILILFSVVLYCALRNTKRIRVSKKRAVLISLRVVSFLLIVFILLNPALRVEQYREEKPHLAILVDRSWSMSLPEDESGISRIRAVRNFFQKHSDFFSKVERDFIVNYYVFDKSLKPVSLDSIYADEPTGGGTDIGEAIKELESNYRPGELSSVILFSDGADNGTMRRDADELLKNIDFHINTVGTSDDKIRDIWIDSVKASEVAFLRYPVSVDVMIKSDGFKASNLPVTLKEGDNVISTQGISIDPGEEKKVEFVITPTSLGRKIYTVSIPVSAGELIKENNQKSFAIDVIVNRIRVLHVAGSPSWDVRFLRKALKKNPSIDLVAFFILRSASDLVFAPQNELSLIPFPVDELFGTELGTFDVVIFQNFDFRPYGIYGFHLEKLRDYVEGGGSFLMIGGDKSFDSGSYGGTPLSEILPVELSSIPPRIEETFTTEKFRAKLTPIGTRHPVMRIIPDEKENEDYWKGMPELDGFNRVEGLKPHVLSLLEAPNGEPVLTLSRVKSGRVAAFLADSSWKWNFVRAGQGDVSPYYQEFWNRLILWLINDPELKDVRVKTDKALYAIGENTKVDVRVANYGNTEEKIEASVVLPDGTQRGLSLEKTDVDRLSAGIEAEQYGVYRVKVKSEGGDFSTEEDINSDEIGFLVEPPENELRSPTTDEGLLRMISERTGGRFVTVKDDPKKLGIDFSPRKVIVGYRTVQIWDRPWFFMALLAFLSLEWLFSRRWGLR